MIAAARRLAPPLVLLGLLWTRPGGAAGVTAASYLGGSGDDELRGVAIASDGSVLVSGNSSSAMLGGLPGATLGEGGGFVAKLDPSGTKLLWLARLSKAGELKLTPQDEPIAVTGSRLTKLAADGSAITWIGADVGAEVSAFDLAPNGDVALIAGNTVYLFGPDGQTQKLKQETGRSHAVAVAVEPKTGDLFASGDQNAGYGTCGGPWRSPFIFRYNAAGERIAKLYDFSGQQACDQKLAADSFFTRLRFEADGELWVTGGADGGNSVLGRSALELAMESPALVGACFPSACYGWKGAAAPRFVARAKSDFTDFERATFIVGHFNKQPVGCSCDVPQDDGSGARPNSAGLDFVFRTSSGDVVGAGSAGWHFPVVNAWFPAAAYTPGYPAVVSVLDHDLKEMKMATLLPGTGSALAAAYRGGRLVVVGSAPDNSAWQAPAGQEAQAEALIHALPESAPLQKQYGGGAKDGFLYVACVTTDDECQSPPGDLPSSTTGGSAPVSGASSGGGSGPTSAAGTNAGGNGPSDASGASSHSTPNGTSTNEATCGCRLVSANDNAGHGLAALLAALASTLARRRKARAGSAPSTART